MKKPTRIMKHKVLYKYSILGIFVGFCIFHPLVMLLSHLMVIHTAPDSVIAVDSISSVILKSFSISMLPWSISFAFFNGVIGLYYGTIKQANLAKEELILNLQKALTEVKTLSGLLPICSSCKKIRDDEGYWQQIEEYIRDHSEADFTHGICNDCVKELYPEFHQKFEEKMNDKKQSY
jgi:hypothetical protein